MGPSAVTLALSQFQVGVHLGRQLRPLLLRGPPREEGSTIEQSLVWLATTLVVRTEIPPFFHGGNK